MEIPREAFIEFVKDEGVIRASLSHTQKYPSGISQFAILDWQYDGELFAITNTGKRVVANEDMPAFIPYENRERGEDEKL